MSTKKEHMQYNIDAMLSSNTNATTENGIPSGGAATNPLPNTLLSPLVVLKNSSHPPMTTKRSHAVAAQVDFFPNHNRSREDIVVHNHDVLSGRGVNIAHHPGNERFRSLVTSYTDKHYCTSYSVAEKKALAMQIIQHIRSLDPPGRFLKREGKAAASRGLSGPWQELTEREVVKKACQALRDCNRQDRIGYADGVKPPEDVKIVTETISKAGLSVKERAAAAAEALEHRAKARTKCPISGRNSSPSEDCEGMIPRGVKRSKDEVDNDYYAMVSKETNGNHTNHILRCQDGLAHYSNIAPRNNMDLEPNRVNTHLPNSVTTGHAHPNSLHYKVPINPHPSLRAGPSIFPDNPYKQGYYPQSGAYNQYHNSGQNCSQSFAYNGYGTEIYRTESGFGSTSTSFDYQPLRDFRSDTNHPGSAHLYNDGSTGHKYYAQTTNQANNESYHDVYSHQPLDHKGSNLQNIGTFEEPWPIKKQRTDDTDPSIGISTSVSSPSTPAALANNDDIGLAVPAPAPVANGLKSNVDGNSVPAVYDDIFRADVDWANDPIDTESIGVEDDGEDRIDDDLNADELFSF